MHGVVSLFHTGSTAPFGDIRFIHTTDARYAQAKMRTLRLKKGISTFTRAAIQSVLVFSDCRLQSVV